MSGRKRESPRIARFLLRLVLPAEDRSHVVDELEELYLRRAERRGERAANRWYRRQVRRFAVRAWAFRRSRPPSRSRDPELHDGGRSRIVRCVDALRGDLIFAWRQIVRRPVGSLLAVGVLALAIGSGAAVFGVVDGVLLRDLPYPDADRVVVVRQLRDESRGAVRVAPPAFRLWSRASGGAIQGLAAVTPGGMDLEGAGRPEHVEVAAASHELFEVLGVEAEMGRTYGPAEDARGAAGTVVLSHELWARHFGGSPDVVGRDVRLGGELRTVVGVMPSQFDFPSGAMAWIPIRPRLEGMTAWGGHILNVLARVRPDATGDGARRELERLLMAEPGAEARRVLTTPLEEVLRGDVRRPLFLLLGAVGLVLLVACANVGGLLLARSLSRRRELAVRTALGAVPGRLASVLLTEAVVLSVLGGVAGVAAARVGLAGLLALAPETLPLARRVAVDGRVAAVALAGTLLTGLAAGLLPALRIRLDLVPALRREPGVGRSGGPGPGRLGGALVVGQVALTVVLLAGAGLLGRSFLDLVTRDRGFEPRGVATANLSLPEHRFPDDVDLRSFYSDVLREARAAPGVTAAALTRNLPLAERRILAPVILEGREAEDTGSPVQLSAVTSGYFSLMGIPLLRGRSFRDRDASGPPVAVVNEAFARRFFPDSEAVGRRFRTLMDQEMMELVGVVADVRHRSLADDPPPLVYRVLERQPRRGVHLVVRSDAPPTDLLPGLREAVERARPGQPVRELATMDALVARSVAEPRFQAQLLAAFAAITLLLTTLGLYALLSDSVHRLRREIGIRLAVGAAPVRVGRLVALRGLGAAGIGLALGLVGAVAVGRFLESMLHGVAPADPLTLGGVSVLLLGVAAAAAWPSVRRATRVDPVEVLQG